MSSTEIETLLRAALTLDELFVRAEGNHYHVIAVGSVFSDLSRVKQQQLIYAPLLEKIRSNEIHALTIKTLTPEQWQRERHFLRTA